MYPCLLHRDTSSSKEMDTAKFPSTCVSLHKLFSALILQLTDSSVHRFMLKLVLGPDNIDSEVELLNPQNLSCFFPASSCLYTFSCMVSSGQLSFFLNPTVFTLLRIIQFCSPPLPALSEILVLGEFLRGIFPALDCQYGP